MVYNYNNLQMNTLRGLINSVIFGNTKTTTTHGTYAVPLARNTETNNVGMDLFNQLNFTDAFTEFSKMKRTNYSITMMVKCLYRAQRYLDALCVFNLFPRINTNFVNLCTEMQYIRARCLYQAAIAIDASDRNTQQTYRPERSVRNQFTDSGSPLIGVELQYTANEYLTNALLIMSTLIELQNHRSTKFTVFLPQIQFALGDYKAAYESCTILSTRDLSHSLHAENFLMRARISRQLNDNVTAMCDYEQAIFHARETTNYGLLALIYADVVLSNGTSTNVLTKYNSFLVSANYEASRESPMTTANYFILANHYDTLNTVTPSTLCSTLMRDYHSTMESIRTQYTTWRRSAVPKRDARNEYIDTTVPAGAY
jgi:tetratricopeptide (TPR) repeat protein